MTRSVVDERNDGRKEEDVDCLKVCCGLNGLKRSGWSSENRMKGRGGGSGNGHVGIFETN